MPVGERVQLAGPPGPDGPRLAVGVVLGHPVDLLALRRGEEPALEDAAFRADRLQAKVRLLLAVFRLRKGAVDPRRELATCNGTAIPLLSVQLVRHAEQVAPVQGVGPHPGDLLGGQAPEVRQPPDAGGVQHPVAQPEALAVELGLQRIARRRGGARGGACS